MPAATQDRAQALTFRVGEEKLALDAGGITEVLRTPKLRRVPLAPPALAGVANLRGAVIPVVSLAKLIGQGDAEGGRVIVTGGQTPVGLIVDQVSALVPAERIGSVEEPSRYLPLDALLDKAFGAVERQGRGVAFLAEAAQAQEQAAARRSLFSFETGGQTFALPLDSVREVIAMPADVAVVPRSDDAMLGVIPLRDQLLPLVSLSVLLGLGAADREGQKRIVVASAGGIRLGLVIEQVRAILHVDEDRIDPVPPVLTRGNQEAHIQAICRVGGGLVSILSTDHLLDPALVERLAGSRSEEKEVTEAASAESEQFVIFQLGEENYGLPIGSVVEVVRAPDRLSRLPKAPAFVEGVINIRGRVVPVIDQRRRFGSTGAHDRRGRIILVRIGEAEAGFMVDGVSEVLRVPAAALRATPELAARGSKVIDRIANLEINGRMYLLVDPQELLDRAEQDMLAGLHRAGSGQDVSTPS
jgi:purine-binding chemotaxis protein CheW